MNRHIEVLPASDGEHVIKSGPTLETVFVGWHGGDAFPMPEWAFHRAEGGYIVENGDLHLFDLDLRM